MQRSIKSRVSAQNVDGPEDEKRLVVNVNNRLVWRTLDSPVRMRLLEMIRRLRACTILELSEAAGTNPVNLYYHVRALESADLIVAVGRREGVARRAPVIYAASHDEIVIEFDPDRPEEVEKIQLLQRNWHREAQESLSGAGCSSIETTEFALRWEFLSAPERDEIASMMARITELLDRKRTEKSLGEAGTEQLVFVGMQVANCSRDQMPTPRVSIQPRTVDRTASSELRDNHQSVARTA